VAKIIKAISHCPAPSRGGRRRPRHGHSKPIDDSAFCTLFLYHSSRGFDLIMQPKGADSIDLFGGGCMKAGDRGPVNRPVTLLPNLPPRQPPTWGMWAGISGATTTVQKKGLPQ
jgi:hypothetical protein